MKRFLSTAAVVALAGVTLATPAAADPPQDFVAGGGTHVGIVKTGVAAHSGPEGEDPRGNVTITQEGIGLFAHGKVTCLEVDENRAIITWVVTSKHGSGADEGTVVVTEIVDNGTPSDSAPPDAIRNSFAPTIVPVQGSPECFRPTLAPVPVQEGNYVVNDAT